MTDCLIVMNGENVEGFFKFENNCKYMTCGLNRKCSFLWVADNACGESDKGFRIVSPVTDIPENCGIFEISENKAHPLLFHGDEAAVRAVAARKYDIEDAPVTLPKEDIVSSVKETVEADVPVAADTSPAPFNEEKENAKIPCSYWDCNENDFMRILSENPPDEEMNMLIPGSRWVSVDDDGAKYLLGVIFNENELPMYLCYGFSLPWSEQAPASLDGYSQWIPKDCSKPHGDGYWVIYVNAKTGERIK